MKPTFKIIFFLIILTTHLDTLIYANNTNISVKLSKEIHQSIKLNTSEKFENFLSKALKLKSVKEEPILTNTIQKYIKRSHLDSNENHILQRLLGLYTRVKYGEKAIETLSQLVAIPTFHVEGVEQHKNPEFIKIGKAIETLAHQFNLTFRNIDNRVFEITLKGQSDEVIGLHAHADVVPVTPSLWVLKDGTHLNPFKLTRIGNRLYGRGAEDDKNGIVVTMYAMKVIQEEKIPLLREFRLLVDTTEETQSNAMPYYFSKNPKPNYNIALDGNYPVIIAEKGYGGILAEFPVRDAQINQDANAEILTVTGGKAMNQIPAASIAMITTSQTTSLIQQLNRLAKSFVDENGGDFSITASLKTSDTSKENSNVVMLNVIGTSAHSSEPWTGVNPVSRMFLFINYVQNKAGLFKLNHITDAAQYITTNWGLDFHGKKIGISFSDQFMGDLTSSVTQVKQSKDSLTVGVNLRIPVGRSIEELKSIVDTHLNQWKLDNHVNVQFKSGYGKPMYRNPKGHWINALLDVSSENLSMPRKFGSSDGGTSIHNLPNGVQFGLAMPDVKYTGHNANEFKRVNQFLLDLQAVTEMITRIGQIPQME